MSKYDYAIACEMLDDVFKANGDKTAESFAKALRAGGPDNAKATAEAFVNQHNADMGPCCRIAAETLIGAKIARKDAGAAYRELIGAPVEGSATAEQRADFLASIGMNEAAAKVRAEAGLSAPNAEALPAGCPSAQALAAHRRNLGIVPGKKLPAVRLF